MYCKRWPHLQEEASFPLHTGLFFLAPQVRLLFLCPSLPPACCYFLPLSFFFLFFFSSQLFIVSVFTEFTFSSQKLILNESEMVSVHLRSCCLMWCEPCRPTAVASQMSVVVLQNDLELPMKWLSSTSPDCCLCICSFIVLNCPSVPYRWWWTGRRNACRCSSPRLWSAQGAWMPCPSRWPLTLSTWRASCAHSTTFCTWTGPSHCHTAITSPSWWVDALDVSPWLTALGRLLKSPSLTFRLLRVITVTTWSTVTQLTFCGWAGTLCGCTGWRPRRHACVSSTTSTRCWRISPGSLPAHTSR